MQLWNWAFYHVQNDKVKWSVYMCTFFPWIFIQLNVIFLFTILAAWFHLIHLVARWCAILLWTERLHLYATICLNRLLIFAFSFSSWPPQQITSTRELTERMESEKKKRARKNWAKIRWKLITWEDWGACVMLEHPISDDHHQMQRPRKYILFHLSAPTQLDSE